MPIHGLPPAELILGVGGGAAALSRGGALLSVEQGDPSGTWCADAVRSSLTAAGVVGDAVGQVAVCEEPVALGLLRRRHHRRAARALLSDDAAFVAAGRVGTGLPRPFDHRDRVTLHPPDRCLAASAYYTSGERVLWIWVEQGGHLTPWLGTSGKVVALLDRASVAEATAAERAWIDRYRAEVTCLVRADPALPRPGVQAPDAALHGAPALAAGAALVARADERQGSWVPRRWTGSGGAG